MAVVTTEKRLLGFKDFFPDEKPKPKEYYAAFVGKSLIEKFCCFFLGHYRHNAVPETRELIERAFIHYNQPFRDSPSYHVLIRQFDRIANFHPEKTLDIVSIETLLNLFIWTQSVENVPVEASVENLSVMLRLLELMLLFNDDVLVNYQKAVDSAKDQHGVADFPKFLLATSYPQHDLINADYGQLVYAQVYKSIRLLNFISISEKYKEYFHRLMADFHQDNGKDFLKALTGVVFPPLNHDPGWSEFSTENNAEKERSVQFLEALSYADEDLDSEQLDYLLLRNNPLQRMHNGNFRVVYDLFLVKKLYNGLIFKLSSYWKDFLGNIRKDFSEEVLVYDVLGKIFHRPTDLVLDGNTISNHYGMETEPDFYVHRQNAIVLFESKDFYIAADKKLSYDYSSIVGELKKDGRLGKAIKQLAKNVDRAIAKEFSFDKDYDLGVTIILPVVIVHDALYSTPSLNYWAHKWFEEELAPLREKYPAYDFAKVIHLTLLEIDSLILYQDLFSSDRLDLIDELIKFQNYVRYDDEIGGQHARVFSMPFSEMFRTFCVSHGLHPNIPLIPDMIDRM